MSEQPRFEAGALLKALAEAGVEFVLIGGLAAQAHGSPSLTLDVDICPAIGGDNLHRLAGCLRDLGAIRRGMPDGVVAPIDARALRAAEVLTLRTCHGDLDLLAHPEPGLGFETLAARARTAELMGIRVLVASLDDLIAMKRAAGRPKDRIELEILGAVREELDRSGG
jgi:hypothetical protein